ncbi:hypothetical protein [Nostoc sp. CALU 546]|uniref:hypothetical protein n=1 Tax=Nostoc sp. CALU 546 TaxID=1867241 RepID=UPI003B67B2B7
MLYKITAATPYNTELNGGEYNLNKRKKTAQIQQRTLRILHRDQQDIQQYFTF